jgi:uncharacterized membrane protein YfcA
MVSIGFGSPPLPALLNIRSSRPQVVTARATAASISASWVTVLYYLERRDKAFEQKMVEVLCVYRASRLVE